MDRGLLAGDPVTLAHLCWVQVHGAVRILERRDGYRVREVYAGRVVARRESVLGFERGGRLDAVAVDEGARARAGRGPGQRGAHRADSLADFQRRLEASAFALPQGYRLELGGEREERSEALSDLMAFALPLFVIMAIRRRDVGRGASRA